MNKKITLVLLLIFTFLIRFLFLDKNPPALFFDEVDAAYQAEIFNMQQGDYFGNKYPVHFHSLADWRTPLYIYSVSLVKTVVNHPEISVRLPSVIFSTLSVYFFYLLTNSFLATALFSLNPWSIHYGRSAFEVSGMLMALLGGFYYLKKYFTNYHLFYLFLSVLFFILTPYFYSTSKAFLVFLALGILIIYWHQLKKIPLKHWFIGLFLCIILLAPLGLDTLNGRAGFRFSYINIFHDPHSADKVNFERYSDYILSSPSSLLSSKINHNKITLVLNRFINNYFSAFSTDFLFIRGDSNSRHGFDGHGLFYYIDALLIILGLVGIYKQKKVSETDKFFIFLLITAPIPFSLTTDSTGGHATRLILMLPSLIYLVYRGALIVKKSSKLLFKILLLVYLVSVFHFYHFYRYDYPQKNAMYWQANVKESVEATKKYSQPIYFSSFYESFLPFFLYYQPYLPVDAPSLHLHPVDSDIISGSSLDSHYFFGHIKWNNFNKISIPPSIFVVPATELSQLPLDKNQQPLLKQLEFIPKKYINSQDFYIFSYEK